MAKKKTSMDEARLTADQRYQVLAAIAAHEQAAGHIVQTPASTATANPATKDATARSARRKYRQEKLGIEDLRTATADEITQAHHDPHALLSHPDVVAQRDALVRGREQAGTVEAGPQYVAGVAGHAPTGGKPPGPTVLGGRPVVNGAAQSPPQVLSPLHMTPVHVQLRKPKKQAA